MPPARMPAQQADEIGPLSGLGVASPQEDSNFSEIPKENSGARFLPAIHLQSGEREYWRWLFANCRYGGPEIREAILSLVEAAS